MEQVLMTAKGTGGKLELLDDRIRITRRSVAGFLIHGLKGSKEILISQISSIQFKRPGPIANGFIQFAFLGGSEVKGGLWQASSDENTIFFTQAHREEFEAIKEELDRRTAMRQPKAHPVSELDELEKLASLRDKGIITEDEFVAKKRQILGT